MIPAIRLIEIEGEYGTLRGVWHPPDTTAGDHFPAVVMFHGLTGSHLANGFIFVGAARKLAAAGIGVLRADFYGSGNSDGEFIDMTLFTEVSDGRRMFDYAIAQPGVDPARMGVLGYSMGGGVAALFVGVEPRVKSLVAWSPAVDPRMGTAMAMAPKPLQFGGLLLGDGYLHSLLDARGLEALDRFTGSTLVVHGTADETVPLDSGKLFAEHTRGQLVTVEGANHGYEHPTWRDQLYAATTAHFTQTL